MINHGSDTRLNTVGDVIFAYQNQRISSTDAWALISELLLDEISPPELESDIARQIALLDEEMQVPEQELRRRRDGEVAKAKLAALRMLLKRNQWNP